MLRFLPNEALKRNDAQIGPQGAFAIADASGRVVRA
jgi:hypothetical protein